MKQKIALLVLLLQSVLLSAQISGSIKDSISQETIPYVNIWVSGQDNGSTADANGNFTITKTEGGKSLIFSAVGYETKTIALENLSGIVYLRQATNVLAEVIVHPKKKIKGKAGKLRGGDHAFAVNWAQDNKPHPAIIAKYFSYAEATPFITTVKVKVLCDDHDGLFNLRFYAMGDDGYPAGFLYDKNILCTVKKGLHTKVIDVSALHLTLPENGIFVAVEYLILDQNRNEHEYEFQNKKGVTVWYGPNIDVLYVPKFTDTWHYNGDIWARNEHLSLAMEIGLSN